MEISLLFEKSLYELIFYLFLTISSQFSNVSESRCFELVLARYIILIAWLLESTARESLLLKLFRPASLLHLLYLFAEVTPEIIDRRVLYLLIFLGLYLLIFKLPVVLNALDCLIDVLLREHLAEAFESILDGVSALQTGVLAELGNL